ncbi:MAG: MoaD/ThiS family protein [Aquificae bacterium]|nr:MoaD/ThiS family protein [Aquificota bacterium]
MEVKVLYFAQARELVGKEAETIRFTGKTTEDLRTLLAHKYPALEKVLSVSRFAVNGEYYEGELKDGDTVAVIPPVGGG